MRIQRILYPNGKELLLIISAWDGIKGWQRNPGDIEYEPVDIRLLDHTPVPRTAEILQKSI